MESRLDGSRSCRDAGMESDATFNGLLVMMRMMGIQDIFGRCQTECMLYLVHAVLSECWTKCML
jgi:hypothetical protein